MLEQHLEAVAECIGICLTLIFFAGLWVIATREPKGPVI